MSIIGRKKSGNGGPKAALRQSVSGAKTLVKTKASVGDAVRKVAVRKAVATKAVPRKAAARKATTLILSAPKGARTLSHRKIKQAVERVFEERYGIDA